MLARVKTPLRPLPSLARHGVFAALLFWSGCGAGATDEANSVDADSGAGASAGGGTAWGGGGGEPGGAEVPGLDPDDGVPAPPPGSAGDGAGLYRELCASCHGPHGEGGAGPPLTRAYQRDYLVEYIDARMPLGNPERCDATCSSALADFILGDLLTAPVPQCDVPAPGLRALRLLSRREYRNSIRDLLRLDAGEPAPGGDACASLADCDAQRASCTDARCVPDPCAVHTFLFDAGGRMPTRVHVAGSFNGWPGTVAAGGWPLVLDAALGRWVLKQAVPEGDHSYKLVIDERDWIADPTNPESAPDGFGGQNSVLRQHCSDARAPGGDGSGGASDASELAALTRDLPPESRPRGFSFETHGSSGVATSVHVEAWLAAAQVVAARVSTLPARFAPCVGEAECPAVFLADFGRRAFRRPLTAAERERYTELWRSQPDDTQGLAATVEALLSSPNFLYRSELGQAQPDGTWRLTPDEIASALSYGFWATMPDETLLGAAADGSLATPEVLERQARRLLADPRAHEQIGEFAVQWLGVDGLLTKTKRADQYPAWDESLARSMLEESRRFVQSAVFDEGARFETLLRGDYTFANDRLAALYGLPGDFDASFRRTPLSGLMNGRRAGVIGHARVLSMRAHSDQTSPIRRGLFVGERLLCPLFGTPPADAGGVPEVDPNATTRERFRQHTAEPRCAACHRYIDDLGFGFEQFDAIGAWREMEAGQPVDHRGNLNDVEGLGAGTDAPYETLPELGEVLANSDRARDCFATQIWRFQRGRLETEADACDLESVHARFRAAGGEIRELIVSVVLTPAFTWRRDADAAEGPPPAAPGAPGNGAE